MVMVWFFISLPRSISILALDDVIVRHILKNVSKSL